MKLAFVAFAAASWALTSPAIAASPSVSVPIEPTPVPIQSTPQAPPAIQPAPAPAETKVQTPPTVEPAPAPAQTKVQAPPAITPTPPDAQTPSQANPTIGPPIPDKVAQQPAPGPNDCAQTRETQALNWLAAAGYSDFRNVRCVGHYYKATVGDPASRYIVTVDPDSGWIGSDSTAGNRETRALNLLAECGYVRVEAIRPAGTEFIARVTRNGKPLTLVVDPDHDRFRRSN